MKNRILYIVILVSLLSCLTTNVENIEKPIIENVEIEVKDPIVPLLTESEILSQKVDHYIDQMSLEEKISQLFILDVRGYNKMDEVLETYLSSFKPGGVILFANNIVNNEQVVSLIKDIKSTSTIPLFISVDEEGGLVSRLGKNKSVDVTYLPPALTVGNKNNTELAFNTGKILGRELKALGFNMDMAPVADVNTNPNNPVIGNRTYSADPYIAGKMVTNIIKGFQEENMISVIKHFPGHGDTDTDTHDGTVVSPHNRERLEQIEFIPFKMGIESGVDAIMSAHVTMPGISSTPLPSTLNPEIMTGILREDLGFNGIIMTDAMDMGAITNNFTSGEAAILAIKAGVDMLLIPLKPIEAFNKLLFEVENGNIDISRIEESVKRIITLKMKRNLIDNNDESEDIYTVQQDPNHQKLIKTIFTK